MFCVSLMHHDFEAWLPAEGFGSLAAAVLTPEADHLRAVGHALDPRYWPPSLHVQTHDHVVGYAARYA